MDKILKVLQWKKTEENVSFHFYTGDFYEHTHNYFEIVLLTKGSAVHKYCGKEYKIEKNDIWFILPDAYHSLLSENPKNCQHLNLLISLDSLQSICNFIDSKFFSLIQNCEVSRPINLKLSEPMCNYILSMIHQCQALEQTNANRKNGLLNCVAVTLISQLYTFYSFENQEIPSWLSAFVVKLNTIEMLSLKPKEVYKFTNYSYSHFESIFRHYYKMSFLQYFNMIKLNYAKNILKTTDHDLLTICYDIGFSSLSHFNHLFKKQFNTTPAKCRKMNSTL